jgi:hypothetical protein
MTILKTAGWTVLSVILAFIICGGLFSTFSFAFS